MKNKLLISAFTLVSMCVMGQPVPLPVPGSTAAKANAAWYRGGNTTPGAGNVLGFSDNTQVWFQTNSANRMLIEDGGSAVTDGWIGIGNIPNSFIPKARLNLYQDGSNGDIFRSDGLTTVNNKWSMWTGGTASSAVERFRITKLTSSFDVDIDNIETASGVGGETSLQLRQAMFRIVARGKRLALFDELFGGIADEVVFGDGTDVNTTLLSNTGRRMFFHGTNGFLGLGDNFSEAGLNPNYNLHLNDAAANNVYEQYTNASTGTGAADGFYTGINTAGVAQLNQQENSDMVFSTNATQRMNVNADGRVTMNATGTPLNLGTAGPAHLTVNAGANEGVFGTRSSGAQPRIYFETVGSTDEFVGHSVPFGFFNNMRSTSGIFWNNINYATWQSDIHINTRTPVGVLPVVLGGNVVSVTQASGRMGLLNTAPANRLEITSLPGNDPKPAGLRFTNLTCASPTEPQCVPAAPVFLSVDNNGDVILVDGSISSGTTIGSYCAKVSNPLTGHYEIPTGNNNIYYPGQGFHGTFAGSTDAIGLGYHCTVDLPAKLSVLQDNNLVDGLGLAPESTTGGSFLNRDISSGVSKIYTGVDAQSTGIQNPALKITNIGGSFFASNGFVNRAVQGRTGNAPPASGTSFAGHFTAAGPGLENFGVFARGVGATGINYGIRAESGGGGTSYAVFASNPNSACLPNQWAGYFNGDVNMNGSGCLGSYALNINGDANVNGILYTTSGGVLVSDASLKKNVKDIGNALELINKLQPKSYDLYNDNCKQLEVSGAQKQYGLIAQEVEKVFPEIVYDVKIPAAIDEEGKETAPSKDLRGVSYTQLISVLVKGMQEQQKQIEELKTLVENSNVTNPGKEQKIIGSVNLSDIQSVILDQNVPNPFAEQTTISYVLTKGVQKAQMLFYNAEGKLINSSELKASAGKGQLNVFASDLSNGIYTYTLVVDGKVIDSKRMVKGE